MNCNINNLVENNMGLVHACANRFKGKGIDYDDLVQAGAVGILKAARLFDEDRNIKFSTYAVPVILGEIRNIFREGRIIKVSRGLQNLAKSISLAREKYLTENDRDPTITELSSVLGVPIEDIVQAQTASLPPVSLINSDDKIIEIPVDSQEFNILELMSLKQVISDLEYKDKEMLFMRYFLKKTQSETAKMLNVNQTKISRREKKILSIIREQLLE